MIINRKITDVNKSLEMSGIVGEEQLYNFFKN